MKKHTYMCYALHYNNSSHEDGVFQVVAVSSTKPIKSESQKEWLKQECQKYCALSVDVIIWQEVMSGKE